MTLPRMTPYVPGGLALVALYWIVTAIKKATAKNTEPKDDPPPDA